MTFKLSIRQLAENYVDFWETQVAAVFNCDWTGTLEKATDKHNRRTFGATTNQPTHSDGNVDLEWLARSFAACAERVDAVDAEISRGNRARDAGTARS